jgi:hypothetical protein
LLFANKRSPALAGLFLRAARLNYRHANFQNAGHLIRFLKMSPFKREADVGACTIEYVSNDEENEATRLRHTTGPGNVHDGIRAGLRFAANRR